MRRVALGSLIQAGRVALLSLGVWALAASALAALPTSREPVLRIETGAHTAAVNRLAADRQARWLVSVSSDATARVWSLRSGALESVLRPPLGDGGRGALYTAAVHPDGHMVALGGNATFGAESGYTVHLMDSASASVLPHGTLSGLEAPPSQLAWSHDGRLLAIGLLAGGLRVFGRDLSFVAADEAYPEPIYGLDFSVDGRLAVASLGGVLKLYQFRQSQLSLMKVVQLAPQRPFAVQFSPDGSRLALGYQDSARVDVLDAQSLQAVQHFDLGAAGNLGRVGWASDGGGLYAAGTLQQAGRFPVIYLPLQGAPRSVGQMADSVNALSALADGSVAVGAGPDVAVFDRNGRTLQRMDAQLPDLRDQQQRFALSADASRVQIGARGQPQPVVFDLLAGRLLSPEQAGPLAPPRVDARLQNWRNHPAPTLNAQALALQPRELARSAALWPADDGAVLGADWSLRRYDAQARLLWAQPLHAPAWVVNVSADARWVVAGLGDGSVHWYRAQDGLEQAALFVHPDQQRWIAWTPQGYYEASVGGEGLLGWHVNRAHNQSADFFTASRFRSRMNHSERVHAALALPATHLGQLRSTEPLPAAAGVRPALAQLPPVIELQSDAELISAAPSVTLKLALRSAADAPVQTLKVRVNGKLEQELSGASLQGEQTRTLQVNLPAVDAEIGLIAENRHGKSDLRSVRVKRPAIELPASPAPGGTPYAKLYLLAVGISQYPNEWALDFPAKDARDFADQMARPGGKLYAQVEQRRLIDAQASRANILAGLKWLRDSVGPKDMGIVFFAGHGFKQGARYYFVPGESQVLPAKSAFRSKAEFDQWTQQNASKLWVPGEDIARTLHQLKGRAVFFVDTCHAGRLARQAAFPTSTDMTGALNELEEEKGVIVFASSTSKELSQESEDWGNGAFTKSLLEGLRGQADRDQEGVIRPNHLDAYVSKRVRQLTNGEQRPEFLMAGLDDPIATSGNSK